MTGDKSISEKHFSPGHFEHRKVFYTSPHPKTIQFIQSQPLTVLLQSMMCYFPVSTPRSQIFSNFIQLCSDENRSETKYIYVYLRDEHNVYLQYILGFYQRVGKTSLFVHFLPLCFVRVW